MDDSFLARSFAEYYEYELSMKHMKETVIISLFWKTVF